MEAIEVMKIVNGETLSVVTILIVAIFLGIKAFVKVWNKHDEDMKTLKNEYITILQNMKNEHAKILETQNKENKENMEAQRKAHMHEKSEFFGSLNETLSQLIKELQISNEVRNKISFDLNEVKSYQGEVRQAITHFNSELEVIKGILFANGDKLSVILKCDMNDNPQKGYK